MEAKTDARAQTVQSPVDRDTPKVSMEIYTDFQSCRDLAQEWDAFVERVSGDIFLTYDWCRIWWKYYGTGRILRIFVFRNENEWVGLFPMFLETVRLGPVSVRRAKMVASDFSIGQFRPAVEADWFRPVFDLLLTDLRQFACDQVLLGPVAGRYALWSQLTRCLSELGSDQLSLRVEHNDTQSYYRLADDYDQWLGRFNTSERGNIKREYRLLEKRSLSFEFEVASENTWEEMFEDFVKLHQENWTVKGKLGHFGSRPRALAFHRELARAQLAKGRLRLLRVRCSDGSRAYAYNYRMGDMYFGYLLGRTLQAPTGVSLGRLLHSEMVRHAIGESVRWIDAMRGKSDYKSQQGGECYPLRMIVLERNGIQSRVRIGLFRRAAKLLHLLYYKIYFYRLSEKLPPRWRGPMWRSWIRACS